MHTLDCFSVSGVCDGPTVDHQVNATVDDVITTLADLQPQQLYLIRVTSVSAANSRSTAVHMTVKSGHGQLPAGVVAACVIAGVIVVTLMIAAISCLVKYVLTCSVPVTCSHIPVIHLVTVYRPLLLEHLIIVPSYLHLH